MLFLLASTENWIARSNLETGRTTPQTPHWLQWGAPYLSLKLPPPMDRCPNPTTCLIPGHTQATTQNCIHIRSAVLPQCTGQTDTETNRWLEEMFHDYRPLLLYKIATRGLITERMWNSSDEPSSCGPTPLMLKPRNVSGPPRKNWSMMFSLAPDTTGRIMPTDADIWITCIHEGWAVKISDEYKINAFRWHLLETGD